MEETKSARPEALKPDVTIELYYPVKLGASEEAETITKLVLRRPRGKDLRDLPASPKYGDLMNIAARLSGHPPSVIDLLEVYDLNRVTEVVGDFLGGGRPIGGTQ